MSEIDGSLSPGQRLFEQLLHVATENTLHPKAELTEEERAHAVGNQLPQMYAFLDASGVFYEIMEDEATRRGFETAEEMRLAMDEIREDVKKILPENEWNTYFDPS